MIQKPKIQYVGQFYVHGSEARQLEEQERKKARTSLPLERLRKIDKITLDPVAGFAILASVAVLAALLMGVMGMKQDWEDYRAAEAYTASLRAEQAELKRQYRDGYDLEEVRSKAIGLGMVPKSEAAHMSVSVTVPQPEPEKTWQEELKWFWDGLWAAAEE